MTALVPKGFARLIMRDIRDGLRQAAGRIVVLLVGVNVLCYLLFTLVASGNTVVDSLSFADYVASCVGGINVYIPRDGDAFKLPAGWLCLCAGIAYIALDYPSRDLTGMGAQAMIAAGGRVPWWTAKCVWVAFVCAVVWMGVLLVCLFWTLTLGGGFGPGMFELTPGVPVLLGFDAPLALVSDMSSGLAWFLVVFPLVMAAVCLLQAVLSVAIAPIVGFVATVAILLASAPVLNPALLGNYLMLARCDCVSAAGLSPVCGLVAAAVLSSGAIAAGALCCSKRDIYGREADVS